MSYIVASFKLAWVVAYLILERIAVLLVTHFHFGFNQLFQLGFMLLALIWKFDFPPFMVLIIAILNDGQCL